MSVEVQAELPETTEVQGPSGLVVENSMSVAEDEAAGAEVVMTAEDEAAAGRVWVTVPLRTVDMASVRC